MMTLTATSSRESSRRHLTTWPNVPWPRRSLTIYLQGERLCCAIDGHREPVLIICSLLGKLHHKQESPSRPAGLPHEPHLRLLDESTSSTLRMRSLCSLSKPSLPRPSPGTVKHRLALAIFTPRHTPVSSERGKGVIPAGNLRIHKQHQSAQDAHRNRSVDRIVVHGSSLKTKQSR